MRSSPAGARGPAGAGDRVTVGVNLMWLRPGQVGGSEAYLCRQLVALAEATDRYRLVAFALPGFAGAHPEVAERADIVTAPVSGGRRPVRVAAESAWLGPAARNRGCRLVHHGGGTLPTVRAGLASVLTVHDLQYLTFPHFVSTAKLAWLREVVPRSVRRAGIVCVPSHYVRGTVIDATGVGPDHVVVVPHPVPPVVAPGAAGTSEAALRARFGLPGDVVVYPAVTWPHKNHVTLVRAVARLVAGRPDLRLVLLGAPGPSEAEVREVAASEGVADRVVRPGRVSDAERDGLYELATCLAFPSRYEGFGVPVIEAMQRGLPVVAADTTALPEVTAGAAVLLDPLDVDAWAGAIDRLCRDPLARAELAVAGRERAAQLTPEVAAAALDDAYGRVLAP